jgi:hypothetical protein
MSGQLVDESIVSAPKQRNTRIEKQGNQGSPGAGGLAGQAGQVPPEGPRSRWTVKTTKANPRDGETPMVDLAIPEFGYQGDADSVNRQRSAGATDGTSKQTGTINTLPTDLAAFWHWTAVLAASIPSMSKQWMRSSTSARCGKLAPRMRRST